MVGLELRLLSGFILTLGIFLVLGIYTYRNNKSQLQTSYKVAHSSEVLLSAEALLNALVDAETGQRGFVISGKAEYLKPYHTSRSSLDKTLRELRGLTSRNELQQEMIDHRLAPLIHHRLLIMEHVIAGRNRRSDAAGWFILAGVKSAAGPD
jgi:CHASE3 domain sensor protein